MVVCAEAKTRKADVQMVGVDEYWFSCEEHIQIVGVDYLNAYQYLILTYFNALTSLHRAKKKVLYPISSWLKPVLRPSTEVSENKETVTGVLFVRPSTGAR